MAPRKSQYSKRSRKTAERSAANAKPPSNKGEVRSRKARDIRAKKIRTKSKTITSRSVSRIAARSAGDLFEAFVALQARLRAPGGCPWDREQTHESLRTYLVEETYEVLDALNSGDPRNVTDELGDLLLQVVFHAEIAKELGQFDIRDVIEHVHTKMVRRHPHVFGNVRADTPGQVVQNWEQIKAEERRATAKASANAVTVSTKEVSVLDGVPRSLPALLEAHQLSRRASNVGFDWRDVEGIFEKLSEEIGELRQALLLQDQAHREEEIGDLLFVCVNLARFLGLDAEIALKKSNRKFNFRFREMERLATISGSAFSARSSSELEELWKQAKFAELRTRT